MNQAHPRAVEDGSLFFAGSSMPGRRLGIKGKVNIACG
jgi:hypothetical protein